MNNIFFSTPYNPEVAEHLISLGYRELRESITDPSAQRFIVVNNLTNTVWTCDTTNLEDTAGIVQLKYRATVTETPNIEILAWGLKM